MKLVKDFYELQYRYYQHGYWAHNSDHETLREAKLMQKMLKKNGHLGIRYRILLWKGRVVG